MSKFTLPVLAGQKPGQPLRCQARYWRWQWPGPKWAQSGRAVGVLCKRLSISEASPHIIL
jgi:predicted exporter